ncbi:cell division protein ZapA [Gaoshiqia sediminis]|uniref:Cell division protein ZapA n=1 Tax=Gaoshiqia sediminis TaxID=2986998 RepID=A0AA41Y4M5_9BACT|nr:cell division protein ZapA [Gaoshiqia sediminis]MCW0481755.1 cell division protein ZapA [Gaoshiqia sediminis]
MADELSINININGRIYPLRIDRKQEEKCRKAAKMINDIVLEYKKKYANQDAQDFLAMTAFQFVLKNLEMEQLADESPIIEELKLLDEHLNDYLSLNE